MVIVGENKVFLMLLEVIRNSETARSPQSGDFRNKNTTFTFGRNQMSADPPGVRTYGPTKRTGVRLIEEDSKKTSKFFRTPAFFLRAGDHCWGNTVLLILLRTSERE